MNNFEFYNPTRIVFGENKIAELARLIPESARILLLYGGGSIKKNGTYEEVITALKGRTLFEFAGIEPNPTFETLMKAVAQVKAEKIDFLLAVGGGSVADGTKFIAVAANYEGDAWEIMASHGKAAEKTTALPMGVVLTLPATGSESNNAAVVTRAETRAKLGFFHPQTYPQFAILDPTKTYSLPPRQIANGVVDAFVHIMEQYLTYPAQAPVQDRFAEGLLLTLIEAGPQALTRPHDYDTRANIMWAATMALNGLIGTGVPQDWATHMLGHELTAQYGLDHAQTLAIVLPAMLTVRRESKRAKLLQYAERVWNLKDGDENERIAAAISKTRTFFEQMGVKTRLPDYQVEQNAIPVIIAQLETHKMTRLGENKDVTLEISRQVLERCF